MKEIIRGDIWIADLEPIKGSEQGGIRPVLIIQNDTGNKFSPTVIVAPITSKKKKLMPTHISVNVNALPNDSIILLEQIRTLDKLRLSKHIAHLSDEQMQEVEGAIDISLGMSFLEGLK